MYVLHNAVDCAAPLDEDFETVLGRAVERGSFDETVFVVPTGRRTRILTRTAIGSLCRKDGRPAGELPFFTLERLVRHCARELMGAKCPRLISDAYRLVLMEEAAQKAELSFFSSGQNGLSPASLERLCNVIYGLKEDGVTPASLREDVKRAETGEDDGEFDRARLADIAVLYETYEALLGSTLADYPRLLTMVTQILKGERDPLTLEPVVVSDGHPLSIRERWEALFPGKTALLLDGFSEFKQPEQEFLGLLRFAPFHTRIYLDYSTSNGPLFANFDETLSLLKQSGFNVYAPDEQIERRDGYQPKTHLPLVSYLRRWLFNTEKDIRHEGFGDMIQVIGAESRVEETRSVAKLVKHLALEEGVPLADIAVVVRQPAQYSTLFREMFALYDIPVNVTDRYPLEKSPVVIAVFAVLDTVLLGFRRGDVHRALQSPYIRCTRRDKGEEYPLDASNLYETAARLRITGGDRFGGADGWLERFDRRLDYLRRRLATVEHDPLADPDEVRQLQRELTAVERARQDFQALVDLLPRSGQLTPAEFVAVVCEQVLERLSVRDSIVEFHRNARRHITAPGTTYVQLQEEVEKDARALSALIRLVEELAFIVEERFPGRKRSLQDYVDRLRTAVRAQRYAAREKPGYGVTVTSIEQIRNIPYRVTILCGAIDSEFPAVYVPESFLGKELPGSEDRFLKRERLLFYQAVSNHPYAFEDGSKRVYITYPLYRGSEEIVRSSFVDALLKVVPLKEAGCELNLVELRKQRMQETADGALWNRVQWVDALGNDEEMVSVVGRYLAHSPTASLADEVVAGVRERRDSDMQRIAQSVDNRRSDGYDPSGIRMLPDGLTPPARSGLERYRQKPYSVTDLEHYKQCPYQYFAARVMGLREKEEYDTALSPLEQGNILHRILYRFYRELQDETMRAGEDAVAAPSDGKAPVPVPVRLDPDDEERYRDLLLTIARDEIEHFQFDHVFFELERDRLLGADGRPGRLELWLREELKRIRNGWNYAPALFELSFGGATADGRTELPAVQLADGVVLRGKIDRVEFGQDGNGMEVLIGDYKTGRLANLPGNADIRRGSSLQMPLYAAAVQRLLRHHYDVDAEPAGAVYYSLSPERTQRGAVESHKFVMLPKDHPLGSDRRNRRSEVVAGDDEKQMMIERAVEHAREYIDGIADGQFTIAPLDRRTTCQYCSYGAVCRIRETAPVE